MMNSEGDNKQCEGETMSGFPNLFDPRPQCLDTEDSVTLEHLPLPFDHNDHFEIWLIISGIL